MFLLPPIWDLSRLLIPEGVNLANRLLYGCHITYWRGDELGLKRHSTLVLLNLGLDRRKHEGLCLFDLVVLGLQDALNVTVYTSYSPSHTRLLMSSVRFHHAFLGDAQVGLERVLNLSLFVLLVYSLKFLRLFLLPVDQSIVE